MRTTAKQRRIVFVGIVTAWLVSGAYILLGYRAVVHFGLFAGWSAAQSAALSATLASIALIAGIGWAARTRQFVGNIDGSVPAVGSALDITLRYVTNTTEQLILFVIAVACMAWVAPETSVSLLPVMGSWFLLARAMFYFGYRVRPLARAVGFAGTFHPTIALFAAVVWALFD